MMHPVLSDFFDGLLGSYTFSTGVENVFYARLPYATYYVGQLTKFLLWIGVIRYALRKQHPEVGLFQLKNIAKEMWRTTSGKLECMVLLFWVTFLFVSTINSVSTALPMMQGYFKTAGDGIDEEIQVLHTRSGGSKSSAGEIDALFVSSVDERSYFLHVINASKTLVKQTEEGQIYETVLYLDNRGQPFLVDDFISE